MYEYAAGAALTVLLLAIEHFALWQVRLSRIWRYTLGVVALNTGISLALALRGLQGDIPGVWAIAFISGGLIASLHKWRELRGEEPGEIEGAFLAGELVKHARGVKRATPGE